MYVLYVYEILPHRQYIDFKSRQILNMNCIINAYTVACGSSFTE